LSPRPLLGGEGKGEGGDGDDHPALAGTPPREGNFWGGELSRS
jgi:hypothetical protein